MIFSSASLFQSRAFEHEGLTYSWLIPEMQKTRLKADLKPLAFPKCFYASVEDSVLVLENLKSNNFEVIDKKPDGNFFSEPLSLLPQSHIRRLGTEI